MRAWGSGRVGGHKMRELQAMDAQTIQTLAVKSRPVW
jgi:hypothetical protein